MGEMARFFLPVTATSILMALSHAIISAGLSRTPQAAPSLAAYAVALNLAFFFEAPAVMLRQTAVTLVRSREDFRVVARAAAVLLAAVVTAQLAVAVTPLGRLILRDGLGVPPSLLGPTQAAFAALVPLPLASGLRCLFQGPILYRRQTLYITLGMATRLAGMLLTVTALVHWYPQLGGVVGSITFVTGMSIEAAISIWRGRQALAGYLPTGRVKEANRARGQGAWTSPHPPAEGQQAASSEPVPLTNAGVIHFLLPLVGLGMLESIVGSVTNAGLSRSGQAEYVLAAFALAWGVAWVLVAALQNLHQVVIVFGEIPRAQPAIRRFLAAAGALATLVVAGTAFTPVAPWLLGGLMGAPPELVRGAVQTLRWLLPLPALLTLGDYAIGRLLLARRTSLLVLTKVTNLAAIAAGAASLPLWAPWFGAAAGAGLVLLGTLMDTLLLSWAAWRLGRRRLGGRYRPLGGEPSCGSAGHGLAGSRRDTARAGL